MLSSDGAFALHVNRRNFLSGIAGTAIVTSVTGSKGLAQSADTTVNLAKVATPSSLYVSDDTKLTALNDGNTRFFNFFA